MSLRKGQRELVKEYREGLCAVPAIPGGGKTHTLTAWVIEVISKGLMDKNKILIVTYMNSAVNNFKQRILAELKKKGINGKKYINVSTVHSLCMKIIKEKPDLALANEEFQIISDNLKNELISEALREWLYENEDQFLFFVNDESKLNLHKSKETWIKQLLRFESFAISQFKAEGLTINSIDKTINSTNENSIINFAAQVFKIYENKLNILGYLDFDDILYKARTIFKDDPLLLKQYQERYKFVCEDEAQDSNKVQNEILALIANGNLLRVGDSNQAICGSFTNSDFKLFKGYSERADVIRFNITQSSRNTREIINIANKFVAYVINNHPVVKCRESLLPQYIEPVDKDDLFPNPTTTTYGVRTNIFDSWEDELKELVKRVTYMSTKFPQKTMAILAPNSWVIEDIEKKLKSSGVVFELMDNTSFERAKPLRVIAKILDFISLPCDITKFISMLDECFFYDIKSKHEEEDKQILYSTLRGLKVEDFLYPIANEGFTNGVPESVKNTNLWNIFVSKLEQIKKILETTSLSIERQILAISEILNFNRLEKAIAQRVAESIKILTMEKKGFNVTDLINELLLSKNHFSHFINLLWELEGYEPQKGVPVICTYHKAKGMEWDIVFLTSITNGEFPVVLSDKFAGEYYFLKEEFKNPVATFKSEYKKHFENDKEKGLEHDTKIETISERTRLLYVGITRAKEYLFMTGSYKNKGRAKETKPSMYLLELENIVNGERDLWERN